MSTTTNTNAPQTPLKTFVFPFTNRESYFAWRAGWRESYALLSKEIRRLKRETAQGQKDSRMMGCEQAELVFRQGQATNAMEERTASKVEAARQWQAARDASRVS